VLLLMTNRKLHMSYRLTRGSMTLDDLELRKISCDFADWEARQQQLTNDRNADIPVLSATANILSTLYSLR